VMPLDRLYESPFIDLSPRGPEGLFSALEVDRLVEVLHDIRASAA
jgi:type I restriction enzyme, R subunit